MLVLGLALVPACARTSADNSQTEEPGQSAAQASDANASTSTRRMTISGVYLDPELTRTCGMAAPKAFFEFDSTVVEGADNSGLSALAQCLSTGPLKGRKRPPRRHPPGPVTALSD